MKHVLCRLRTLILIFMDKQIAKYMYYEVVFLYSTFLRSFLLQCLVSVSMLFKFAKKIQEYHTRGTFNIPNMIMLYSLYVYVSRDKTLQHPHLITEKPVRILTLPAPNMTRL